jgi:malate permease and related proteins
MSQSVQIILNTLALVAILLAIGFLTLKIKLVRKDHLEGISKLIVHILLPCTLFNLIVNSEAVLGDYLNAMPYLALVGLVYLFLYGLGHLLAKLLKLQGQRKSVFRMFMIFGNITYFGIPLMTGLYPNALSVLHLTQHNVLDAMVLWSFGILILNPSLKSRSPITIVKTILTPTMIALLAGLVFMSLGWKVPSMPNSIIKGLADSLKFISLVYMGMLLATIDVKPVLKDKSVYVLIFVKMIFVPLLLYGFASFFFIDQSSVILALMFGLPGMIMVSILVSLYDSDTEYAAGIVFLTTIAALITLPLLVTVISSLQAVIK